MILTDRIMTHSRFLIKKMSQRQLNIHQHHEINGATK